MNSIEIIRRLHQHRQWSNGQLLEACAALSRAQLRQPFEIGQGCVWKTLTHLYAAEYVWLEALLGNQNPRTPGDAKGKLPGNQEGLGGLETVAELAPCWDALNERWAKYLASLEEASLPDIVHKTSSLTGQFAATRRSDILLHVCTHAQYTTAQLVNMLRHLGVPKLPDPMMITMARQETPSHESGP